jgi:hypothetical protein
MAKDTEKDPLLDDEDETTGTGDGEGTSADDGEGEGKETEQEVPATPARARAPRTTASAAAKPTAPAAEKQAEPMEGAQTNAQKGLLTDAEATRRALAKAPKVWFMVPLSPFEKEGAYEEVYINGYRTTIKKGVMVEIPQPVMEILANKYRIETEAGKDMRIDRDTRTEDALA